MSKYAPPVKGGHVIGGPYGATGTHSIAFNKAHGSDNWESENAVDIAVPVGTPVYAVTSGTIGSQFGSLGKGGRFAGLRLHLKTSGGEFYYAHLSGFAKGIGPGSKVTAGQLLGYSGSANGVEHLHFASTTNLSPVNVIKGMGATAEPPQADPGAAGSATTPDASGQVDPVMAQGQAQQQSAIANIPQVGGAPLAHAPLAGDYADTSLTPVQSAASTWQLIASQGNVSPDTLRLAQLASYGMNGGTSPAQ